jgi:broad specificity phosphatase PhoE
MFYLIRHGLTEFNQTKKMQGWMDIELNEVGFMQAEQLANHLVDIPFEYVYASDLKRAYQTAEAYSRISHQHIIKDEMLREINLGDWEGKTWSEVEVLYKDILSDPHIKKHEHSVHGGESFIEFQERVVKHFMSLIKKHKDEDVIIFTHGGNIRMLLLHLYKTHLEEYSDLTIDNASITIIKFDEKSNIFEIVKTNDTEYMKEG